MTADVVIVGGGVVGSSIALHLRRDGFTGRILIVERDPTYARSSSHLAMGGIRQQFGSATNIRMVQYSVTFFEELEATTRSSAPARSRSGSVDICSWSIVPTRRLSNAVSHASVSSVPRSTLSIWRR